MSEKIKYGARIEECPNFDGTSKTRYFLDITWVENGLLTSKNYFNSYCKETTYKKYTELLEEIK